MEEILSSIKRIIAEEGDGPTRGRRLSRPTPPPRDDDAEVLELSDPIPDPARPTFSRPEPRPDYAPAELARLDRMEPVRNEGPRSEASRAEPARTDPVPVEPLRADAFPASETARPDIAAKPAPDPEPIISESTAEASRGSLEHLSRLLVKPEPSNDGTLEGMVREMLRPMLREWLDRNLPAMVETLVADEIARITGQPR